ncbi:hypothetical protein HOG21_01120 [bacterium]|jgi:hypothetical protein|nr:hypothetical protein [bacterium]
MATNEILTLDITLKNSSLLSLSGATYKNLISVVGFDNSFNIICISYLSIVELINSVFIHNSFNLST